MASTLPAGWCALALALAMSPAVGVGVARAAPAASERVAPPPPPPSPFELELRAGWGLSTGGGAGMSTTRRSPLTVAAGVAFAVRTHPATAAYARLVAEALDRSAIGAAAGLRVQPGAGPLRLGGGVSTLLFPYTALGAATSAGGCGRVGRGLAVCGDLEATFYVAGSDIPDGRTVVQVQLVAGVVFDAM